MLKGLNKKPWAGNPNLGFQSRNVDLERSFGLILGYFGFPAIISRCLECIQTLNLDGSHRVELKIFHHDVGLPSCRFRNSSEVF